MTRPARGAAPLVRAVLLLALAGDGPAAVAAQDEPADGAWFEPLAVLGGGGVRTPGGIASLALGPPRAGGARLVLTGGVDGRVLAWGDAPSLVLEGTPSIVALFHDGERVAALDGEGTLHAAAWPREDDGATPRRLPGVGRVVAFARGEHAGLLFAGSTVGPERARIDLRRPDDPPATTTLDALRTTAAAADDEILVWAASSPDDDGPHARLERVNLASGRVRARLELDADEATAPRRVDAIAIAPDGLVLLGLDDGSVRAWPDEAPALGPPRLELGERVGALAASARWIVAGGPSGTVHWVARDGEAASSAPGLHPGGVSGLAFLGQDRVLGAGFDGHARELSLATGRPAERDVGHEAGVCALAWSPDGRSLLSGGLDGTARVWDVADGAARHVLAGHTGFVHAVAWSPRGDVLATAGEDGRVRLWDAADGGARDPPLEHERAVGDLLFARDGTWLASVGDDGTLRRWFVDGGLPMDRTAVDGRMLLALARGGAPDVLLAGSSTVYEVDVHAGRVLGVLDVPRAPIGDMVLHPDGRTLVLGAADRAVHLVDLQDAGRPARRLGGHAGRVAAVAVSPDGAWIVSGAQNDPLLRGWHGPSRRARAPRRAHAGGVLAAAFSPDGGRLATGGRDEVVRLWRLVPPAGADR